MKTIVFAAGAALAMAAATPAAAQDTSLPANYGEVTLEAGFVPDPHIARITAGGTIEASSIEGASCVGRISDAPDYKVNYTAGGFPLVFESFGSADTTLIVNDANGNWHCDDDSGPGLNARLVISEPGTGRYDIWIGTFGESTAPAKLTVSEMLPEETPAG